MFEQLTKQIKDMSADKDILSIWIERIRKESKRGDKTRACKNTGVSYTTHQNAMKQLNLIDLTDSEMEVLKENIRILDERKSKLKECYANN